MSHVRIRPERPADEQAIAVLIARAFAGHPHSDGSEGAIVERLRRAGALTQSLLAELNGQCVGHIAFSPVRVGAAKLGWYGLAPLAVAPEQQRSGIGSALVHEGLRQLQALGGRGCVVLGEPDYYRRFGFAPHAPLVLAGAPADHFLALAFRAEPPGGVVAYDAAFDAPA